MQHAGHQVTASHAHNWPWEAESNHHAALCSADELVAIANPRMAPLKAEAMET